MTPRQYFEDELPKQIAADPAKTESIGEIQFKITGAEAGVWAVDFTKDSDWVAEGGNPESNCTLIVADTDFIAMVTGELNGMQAFMMGKLKVEGDINVAMKLGNLLNK